MRTAEIVAALLLMFAGSQALFAALPPEVENPQCLGVNKEPYHATLMPYANLSEALAANRGASTFCRSLNGPWKFNWVKHPDERPMDFFKTEFDASAWKDIPVPSCWQLQGYGTPYYKNLGYIIKKAWPSVMAEPPKDYTAFVERNPVGSYRRDFEVPADWQGRRIFIKFDGVDSAFFLWINGQKVGYSVNSRNAAEFDITKYVKPGKNMVAVEVYRFSSGTYLEDQDMWRLSGIYRNVTLWSSPEVHIRDFFAKPDLDAQYKDAKLDVTAKVKNYGEKAAEARKLTVEVYDRAGKSVGKGEADVPALNAGEEKAVSLSLNVANPEKWTAETPNLYTTVLSLGTGEILSTRTGFRKVEIKGRVYMINGVPVKLKGANRHENWPDTGHYVTEERMKRDLEVLKQGNCNHVRTCHYSDDPRWYELCDEWGMYLNAEANVESHGYGYGPESLSNPKEWEAAHVDRNVANVENFKNHASVVMWSLGNEAGSGPNFHAALKAIKAIDVSRPSHYERFGTGDKNPADVDSQMYTHPHSLDQIARNESLTKPFYMCEYAHAMFNSMGSIGEYNDIFDKYPSLMGGAIWEWQDQGIWNGRDPNRQYMAYGGGFGEVPNDHYFIHKGVVFGDRSPKPHYPEMKKAYQWIGIAAEDLAAGKVKFRNKYQFINLSGFKGVWTVSEDGTVIDKGDLETLDLAPGAEKVVAIGMKKITPKPGAEYFLNITFTLTKDELWAKAGYEFAAAQFKLPLEVPAAVADVAAMKPVKLEQDDSRIAVVGEGFSVAFDKVQGTVSQLTRDGVNLLAPGGGPRLHLWRAPHRNDDMWAYGDWNHFGLTELKWTAVSMSAEQIGPATVRVNVVTRGEGKSGFGVTHSAAYTIYGDGSIAVDNAMSPQGKRMPVARIGVRMLLDRKLDQFVFLGRGPMENYADRKRGFDVNVYSTTVKGNMTPYAKPMECGNHEDVRWAALAGKDAPGLMAQADGSLLQSAALPYTDEVMTPIEYTVDLPESNCTAFIVAARTLGVGSSGCGPRPLDEYVVYSEPCSFSYVLRLLSPVQVKEELPTLGRRQLPARVKPVIGARDINGKVSLSCETAGAKIEYSMDAGKTWQVYSAPFELKDAAVMTVRSTAADKSSFTGSVAFGKYNARVKWKVTASSYQQKEGEPANVLDNNTDTFWHSRYKEPVAKHPHHLIVDFADPLTIAAVKYGARRGNTNGQVKDYEIYFSNDGKKWGEAVVKGSFAKDKLDVEIPLPKPVKARYMKFVALSEHSKQPYGAIAELDIVEAAK